MPPFDTQEPYLNRGPSADACDILRLVRSIQRRKGEADCFGRYNPDCRKQPCTWQQYCIEWTREKARHSADNKGPVS